MGLDANADSKVLDDIIRSLGPMIGVEDYGDQILGLIDIALLPLEQVGAIKDCEQPIGKDTVWSGIINDPPINHYNVMYAIKMYVYINVKLLFDPPTSAVINVLEKRSEEMLWRIRASYDQKEEGIVDNG